MKPILIAASIAGAAAATVFYMLKQNMLLGRKPLLEDYVE